MTKKKELVKNTAIIFIGRMFTQLLTILMLPLYTSYLITAEYGYVDLVLSYITLVVPIVILQLDAGVFRFLISNRGKEEETNKVISSTVSVLLKTVLTASLVYIALMQFINIDFKYYILVCAITSLTSSCMQQISRGLGNNLQFSIASVLTGITTIGLNIYFIVFLNMGALGMILALTLANLLCTVYLFFILKTHKKIKLKYIDKKMTKDLLSYSMPLIPNSISWWIVNISDRTIITAFLSVSANGIYAIANKFPSILNSILGIFSMSWTESASLHIDAEDKDEFFTATVNTSIRFFGCMALGIITCLPFVFPILIDSAYSDAYNYVPILILAALFNMFVINYSAIYIAKKLTKQVMYTSIVSAAINIILNLLFINLIGLYAASISTAVSYALMALYRAKDVKKYVNIKYEYKYILLILIMFVVSTTIFYFKITALDIINLIMVVIISYLLNKDMALKVLNKFLNKFLRKKV